MTKWPRPIVVHSNGKVKENFKLSKDEMTVLYIAGVFYETQKTPGLENQPNQALLKETLDKILTRLQKKVCKQKSSE